MIQMPGKTGRHRNGDARITHKCPICGRYFWIFKSQIDRRRKGIFCTRECFRVARGMFRIALATGLFEEVMRKLAAILKEEKEEEKKAA